MDRTHQFQDTRERILSVGESLILARGFSAVGLSEILSKAEVPKGSFYHYFRSKEGFGVALLERYFQGYDNRIASLFGSDKKGGKEAVLAYFRQWREIQKARPAPLALAVALYAAGDTDGALDAIDRSVAAHAMSMMWLQASRCTVMA